MERNKVSLVNMEKVIEKSGENDIFDDIIKTEFFRWMNDNGYDMITLRGLFDNKRINSSDQMKFNNALKQIKKDLDINIYESILFIEESFVKFKKIINLLDDEVKHILKHELEMKYKINNHSKNHFDELLNL